MFILAVVLAVVDDCDDDDDVTDADGVAADNDASDGDDDDNDNKNADEGGVTEPFAGAFVVTFGHGAVDIDDCMLEVKPFNFCCCFSFSGITIWLG